jgi:Arc/MetJ-type ribon-helix-helix transcriptional regulator
MSAMPETEKLTININPVDLGQIELLVDQGFYANRAEFIRVAIHDQLEKHAEAVKESSTRQALVIGALVYDRDALEKMRRQKHRLAIRVVGHLSIGDDVPASLAKEVIASIKVYGTFRASPQVKAALAERTSS